MTWSTKRIEAYKRYIKTDTNNISSWERSLREHTEGLERAKRMIESTKRSRANTIAELAEQGIVISITNED